MTNIAVTAKARTILQGIVGRFLALLSLTFLLTGSALAQKTPTDGYTPLGLLPGAPAGSYALSDFENVNVFNGNLNFHLPLLRVGGRGAAGYTMTLPVEQQWRIERGETPPFGDTPLLPNPNWWDGIKPGYGPGVLQGRRASYELTRSYESYGNGESQILREVYLLTLTRLTFTMVDGTEFELRDSQTGGAPQTASWYPQTGNVDGFNRGTIFSTADGTSATFVSDTPIKDRVAIDMALAERLIYPSGYLLLRDGTRYRIDSGVVSWIRDRNGNKVTFGGGAFATDSLNRQVTITSGSGYEQINFGGFGGAARTIRVWYDTLGNRLRPNSGYSLKTYAQLFPELNSASSYTTYNPGKVSRVELPDGRSYQFYYNAYGELARVVLPTGGAIEYDWGAGITLYSASASGADTEAIYRRVLVRRVYKDASSTTYESKTTYSRPDGGGDATITVDTFDGSDVLLTRSKHYFYGDPYESLTPDPTLPGAVAYPRWKHGREYKTEVFDVLNGVASASPKRRVTKTWAQKLPLRFYQGTTSDDQAANDSRLVETTTTLVDTNQVSKMTSINPADQTAGFDQYNNQTDVWEYDYGAGAPGALLRRTHTDFLTINPVNGADYTSTSTHMRSLPTQQQVFDANGVERARTTFEYDKYAQDTTHAPLMDRTLISGLDTAFTSSYQTRGNVTATTKYLLDASGVVTGSVSSYAQYDVAGNMVKAIDARGHATSVDYSDRYGAPDGEARANSAPVGLGAQVSFALPTSITNAVGQTGYTQHDYYTGAPVDGEDISGVVNSSYYDDLLDRPTQIVRAVNSTVKNQISFSYDDVNRIVSSTSDLNSFNDNQLKTETVYDGLGRSIEARSYEGGSYIATRQTYDALGRASKYSNPFRPAQESPTWTTTQYDALGRVLTVKTPDNAVVSTEYSGNQVTVTDQAGKVRRSISDALGRLTQLVEDPNNLAYQTNYTYDVLGNLTQVNQGSQTRTFTYNSLSQLMSATNPESGTIAYQYDANGNLTSKTDARNITTTYVYDALNRATTRSYSDSTPTVTYTYDTLLNGKGRLSSVSSSVSAYNYVGYDAMGRVTGSSQVTDGQTYSMSYGYNLAGAIISETYPSGRVVTTSYDNVGRLSQVSGQQIGESNKTYASQFSYSAHGAVTEMKLGNNLWEHTIFNNRLQPLLIGLGTSTDQNAAAYLNRFRVDYYYGTTNNNGNVLHQTISVPDSAGNYIAQMAQVYSYDELNRLKTAQENGGASWKQTFLYDRYGNRTFDTANTTQNALGSLLTIDQSNNRFTANQGHILYDSAGNLTREFNGHTFGYDGENKQVSYDGGAAAGGTDYRYDGDGKRVKKVSGTGLATTIFVYNAMGQMVAEYDTNSQQGSGGTSYLTSDTLGTPRVITDSNGNVMARHDYLPFGEEIAYNVGGRSNSQQYIYGTGNPDHLRQKFTGKERDNETALDYFNARYYSSAQGRFTSVDPENYQAMRDISDPQSWNAYAYVNNNPLRRTDPDGRGFWEKVNNWLSGYGWRTNQEVQQLEDKWRNWLRDREQDAGGTLVYCPGGCAPGKDSFKINIDSLSRDEVFRYAASLKEALASGNIVTYSKDQIDQMAGLGNNAIQTMTTTAQGFASLAGSFTTVGQGLKNIRDIGSGRLKGYTRGNTELTGGDQAARDTFRQLTGRAPAGTYERVVQGGKEVVYRASSRSGPSKIEIVDHAQKFMEKISFK